MVQPSPSSRSQAGTGPAAGVVIGLVGALTLLVLAFLWPATTAQARDVRVAVAGPAAAVAAFQGELQAHQPRAFELVTVPDRAAAVRAIESRDVVGGLVLGTAPEVLSASAGSAQLSQVMTVLAAQVEQGLQAQADAAAANTGRPAARVSVTVTDLVPPPPGDPRGTGFMVGMFPLVIGGILGGAALWWGVRGPWRRTAATAGYAVVAGLTLTAVLRSWFGTIEGSWWAQASAIALMLAAIAAPVAGLAHRLGWPGVPAGAVLMLLVGNPLSGVMIPEQFLPAPWGAVGQWLPPGAGASLLRDLSWFPSADATRPWLVLGAWALAGLALGVTRRGRPATVQDARRATLAAVPA